MTNKKTLCISLVGTFMILVSYAYHSFVHQALPFVIMRIKASRYLSERTRRGKKSNRIKRIQYYNKGTDVCLLFHIELPRDTVKFKLLKSSVMDNLRIPDSFLQKLQIMVVSTCQLLRCKNRKMCI